MAFSLLQFTFTVVLYSAEVDLRWRQTALVRSTVPDGATVSWTAIILSVCLLKASGYRFLSSRGDKLKRRVPLTTKLGWLMIFTFCDFIFVLLTQRSRPVCGWWSVCWPTCSTNLSMVLQPYWLCVFSSFAEGTKSLIYVVSLSSSGFHTWYFAGEWPLCGLYPEDTAWLMRWSQLATVLQSGQCQ